MAAGKVHVIDDLIVINDNKTEYIIPKNGGFLDVPKIRINGKRQMSIEELRKIYIIMVNYKGYTQKDFYFENERLHIL